MKKRSDRIHQMRTEQDTVLRRLNRGGLSTTVSYVNADGDQVTRVGEGLTIGAQIAEADSQLPPGEWTRCAVSRPASIYNDVVGRPRDALHGTGKRGGGFYAYSAYEGRSVIAA